MTTTPNDNGDKQTLSPATAHAPTVIGHGKAPTTAHLSQGHRYPTTIILPRGKKNAPVNQAVPYIIGNLTENEILTGYIGTWSPVPTSVAYQWLRDGSPIAGVGAIGSTYTLTTADVGHNISLQVTASNKQGSNTVVSAQTAAIHAAAPPNFAPVNVTPPVVSGVPTIGSVLTVNSGSWSAFPAATFAYLWYRNGVSTGTVGTSYTLSSADANATIYAKVTASNVVASTTAQSNSIGPVQGLAPQGIFRLGLNMSGMEYGDRDSDIAQYAITIPDSQLQEVKSKGFDHIRLPLRWERIERTTARTVLDPTGWGNVIDALTRCKALGLAVIPDIHNFAARWVATTTTSGTTQNYVGMGATRPDGSLYIQPGDLAATWGRMVTDIRARGLEDAILGYDLMNEPKAVSSSQVWLDAAQLAINAIRATGSTLTIFVEGQPYSGAVTFPEINPNITTLIDPANNLIFSGHNYGDYDNSGAATGLPMTWAVQGGRKVEIPVDPIGNPNEVVDEQTLVRRADHMLVWLKSKGIFRIHLGEGGVGRDSIHWNNQIRNYLTWAVQNKAIISLWAGGGLGDGYELGWSAYADGLQREQMAVIDEFKGNPVPTFYRVTVPPRIASGATTIPVTIKYNGLIPNAITFTPSDNGAGGSFSPATITTNVTENWVGTVTYTPAANTNGQITVANDKGWPIPGGKPFSSFIDTFTAIEGDFATLNADGNTRTVNRVFSIYQRQYKSYTGPLVRLGKLVGGVQTEQDFGRATGLETLDTAATAAFATGADSGIVRLIKCYDQGPSAGLTSNTNITARQVIEGGWSAVAFSDYPLWINDAGDGKPVARWTGTTYMDFTDSMLNRDNACVVLLAKNTGGYNCLNWQFSNKFMVFPGYECSRDGATLSFGQTTGTWSHVIAGRTRNSTTGTVGWLNGVSKFTAPALDLDIQDNPTGAGGPDYRDQCGFGYYRFTPGSNTWQGDFREAFTFNWTPSDTRKTALWTAANSTYAITTVPTNPVLLDQFNPKYRVDFLQRKELLNGVQQTAGTYVNGTMVTTDATKGMVSTAMASGSLSLKGALKTALFSDNWTIRVHMWTFSGSGDGQDILKRDGVRWIYEKFSRIIGQLSASDRLSEDISTGSLPTGGSLIYAGGDFHDIVVTISRGKGRLIVQCNNPDSTIGVSVQNASTESMIAEPTVINLGDATHTYYISRIDVWDQDIQDITQVGEVGTFGHNYVSAKGSNLATFLNGHNLSGLENGPLGSGGPFEGELDYYENFGINYYRLPISPDLLFNSWQAWLNDHTKPFPTVASTTAADMNSTYTAQMDRFINYALSKGRGVLIDWHGFGGPLGQTLGGTFDNALFAQVWSVIATRWPNCDYDLQNEPQAAASTTGLATAYQQAVNAIRATGATGYIHLEPGVAGNYGQIYTFDLRTGGADYLLTVTDTLNKLVYHGHRYFDNDGSGRYEDIRGKYEGLIYVQEAIAWARYHNVKLFVGEIGYTNNPTQHPDQDREAQWLFARLYNARDVLLGWAYWTGGIYFKDYYYGTWPVNWNTINQTDRPQMAVLKLYPGTGYTPPTPLGLPVITLSTETDVSALAGATLNTYQTDLRVSPVNANHQVITAKYGATSVSETQTIALTTLDRWASASSTIATGTGDPDVAFDKDGNAYWTTIGKGDGTPMGARKKTAGTSTWAAPVNAMTVTVDHPHIVVDPWSTSTYYNRKYFAGRGVCSHSDDGVSWPQVSLPGGDTKFNNGFVFGGAVAKSGAVFYPYKSAQTITTNSAGAYAGSTSDFYVLRSTDGGASFAAVAIYTSVPVASPGLGGYYACSNIGYTPPTTAIPNGRLHLVVNQDVSGGPCKLMYFTSDDLGLTWTAAGPTLGTVSGFGAHGACFTCNSLGMLVMSWMATNGTIERMYAIASRDSGKTWCNPVQINTTDWADPAKSTQNRTPTQDQMYSGVALSDGSFEVCWTQNAGSDTYHAQRRKITVA